MSEDHLSLVHYGPWSRRLHTDVESEGNGLFWNLDQGQGKEGDRFWNQTLGVKPTRILCRALNDAVVQSDYPRHNQNDSEQPGGYLEGDK